MDAGKYRRLSAGAYDSSDDEQNEQGSPAIAKYRTFVCLSVMVALLADYLLLTVIIPIMPVLLPPATHTTFDNGILFAAQPAVQFIVNPAIGMLVDRSRSGRAVMFTGTFPRRRTPAVSGWLFA